MRNIIKNIIKTKKLNVLKTFIILSLLVLTSNLYAANVGLNRPNDNLVNNNVYPGYNPYYRNDGSNDYQYRNDFTPYIINRVVDHMDVDHKFASNNEDVFEFKNRDAYITFNVGPYNKVTFTIAGDGYSRQGNFTMTVNSEFNIIEKYTHTVNDVVEHTINCNQYENITIKLSSITAPVEWKRRVYVYGIKLG